MKNNKNKLTDNYDYLSSAMRNISSTYHYSQCARHGEHQPLKYTGKELERYEGVDDYDFGARWYNATSLTTSTAGPLTAETPQLSPYAYCADNPIRNIDPKGKDFISTLNLSDQFRLNDVRNYIGIDEFNKRIEAMENSNNRFILVDGRKSGRLFGVTTHLVRSGNDGDYYEVTICVDLHTAVVLDENNTISSALAVFHELDHAARFAQDPNGYVADVNTDNETYGNVEEKRVIEETENVKASQLNEPIRNNHSYHDIVEIDDVRYHKTNGVEYYK